MVAAVDFDHDLRLSPGESVGQDLYSFAGVDTDQQLDPLRQCAQPGATHPGGPHWVGDEQVGEARVSENFRLTDGRDCEADRAERQLATGNLQTLVGLGVRAQGEAAVTRAVSHRDKIGFQDVAVDHQARGLKVRG